MGSVAQVALHADEAWPRQQPTSTPGLVLLARVATLVPVGCYERLRSAGSLPVPVAHSSLVQ